MEARASQLAASCSRRRLPPPALLSPDSGGVTHEDDVIYVTIGYHAEPGRFAQARNDLLDSESTAGVTGHAGHISAMTAVGPTCGMLKVSPCQPRARTGRQPETLKCRQAMSRPAVTRETAG